MYVGNLQTYKYLYYKTYFILYMYDISTYYIFYFILFVYILYTFVPVVTDGFTGFTLSMGCHPGQKRKAIEATSQEFTIESERELHCW